MRRFLFLLIVNFAFQFSLYSGSLQNNCLDFWKKVNALSEARIKNGIRYDNFPHTKYLKAVQYIISDRKINPEKTALLNDVKQVILLSDGFMPKGKEWSVSYPDINFISTDIHYRDKKLSNNYKQMKIDNTKSFPFKTDSADLILMSRGLCFCSSKLDLCKTCAGIENEKDKVKAFLKELIRVLDKKSPRAIAVLEGQHVVLENSFYKAALELSKEEKVDFTFGFNFGNKFFSNIIIQPRANTKIERKIAETRLKEVFPSLKGNWARMTKEAKTLEELSGVVILKCNMPVQFEECLKEINKLIKFFKKYPKAKHLTNGKQLSISEAYFYNRPKSINIHVGASEAELYSQFFPKK